MRRRWVRWLPLAVFAVLLAFLGIGLQLKPREVPSPLLNKAMPVFKLPTLAQPAQSLSPQDLRSQVWLLNVWASWCVACREEHPLLMALSQQPGLHMVGLNYKELQASELAGQDPQSAEAVQKATARSQAWLQKQGQAFGVNLLDMDGRVGMDFGVYGLPETYLVDREGVVRFKHAGALTPDVVQQKILPLLRGVD